MGEVKFEKPVVITQTSTPVKADETKPETKIGDVMVSGGDETAEANTPAKPLKAVDIDYSTFKKDERGDAQRLAERSLNEIKDYVRQFNKDFPAKPYTPPYADFPKPEQYEQFAKNERYNLWANSVTEWVEDCKQDMQAERDTNLSDLKSEFEAKVDRNFVALCGTFEITLETLQNMYEEVKGDMNEFYKKANDALARAKAEIMNNTNNNAIKLHKHIDGAAQDVNDYTQKTARSVRGHIDDVAGNLSKNINDAAGDLCREIYIESIYLGGKIDKVDDKVDNVVKNQEDEKARAKSKEYIANCWHNQPVITQEILRNFYKDSGKHLDRIGSNGLLPLPDRDNNAIQSVIENMSLSELQALESKLRNHRLIKTE